MTTAKSLLPEEVVIELPISYENDEEKPFLLNFLEENDFTGCNLNLLSRATPYTTSANDILDFDET